MRFFPLNIKKVASEIARPAGSSRKVFYLRIKISSGWSRGPQDRCVYLGRFCILLILLRVGQRNSFYVSPLMESLRLRSPEGSFWKCLLKKPSRASVQFGRSKDQHRVRSLLAKKEQKTKKEIRFLWFPRWIFCGQRSWKIIKIGVWLEVLREETLVYEALVSAVKETD